MIFLETPTDETVIFFKTNKSRGNLTEDMVKFYAPGCGSPYNKVNVCAPIGGSTRDDVRVYTTRWITKRNSEGLDTSQLFACQI